MFEKVLLRRVRQLFNRKLRYTVTQKEANFGAVVLELSYSNICVGAIGTGLIIAVFSIVFALHVIDL